jgi:phosphatidylinositol alpha-1,6-mannosyltransferase
MKTLLLSEIFPPQTGGSGRWFWEVYRRLPRGQYVIAAGEHPQQAEFDATHDLRVLRLPLRMDQWGIRSRSGLAGYWRAVRRLAGIVRREGIQRMHCGRCLPEGVMALALRFWKRIPYACYVHGEDVGTAGNSREHAFLVRRVLRHAELLIANSHNTARLLQQLWRVPGGRITVLHPGVDVTRFVPAARNADVRRDLGWGQRPVVLSVGRLQRRKGQDRMIQALIPIRRSIPDVLYVVIGDGEERSRLEQLVEELHLQDHVQFRGEESDERLVQCYQQCDVFALPNREISGDIEGFGIVLLEAQACGKPVLAGDSGGTAETMRTEGEKGRGGDPEKRRRGEGEKGSPNEATGVIVNCQSPEPLAEAVIDLLGDPQRREAMGRAGRVWVEERFSWEMLSRQADKLFSGV